VSRAIDDADTTLVSARVAAFGDEVVRRLTPVVTGLTPP
jgi:hypothetical protein